MARRYQSRRGGARRLVTWVGPAEQGFVNVATGGTTLIASFTPTTVGIPKPTVVRTRGMVGVQPQLYSADLDIVGAFGLAVVSAQALAAGAGSISGPFDDAGWDGWFVWGSFNYHLDFSDETSKRLTVQEYEVDSKAMRKISDNEAIVLMAESANGALQISMPLRMLLKLS